MQQFSFNDYFCVDGRWKVKINYCQTEPGVLCEVLGKKLKKKNVCSIFVFRIYRNIDANRYPSKFKKKFSNIWIWKKNREKSVLFHTKTKSVKLHLLDENIRNESWQKEYFKTEKSLGYSSTDWLIIFILLQKSVINQKFSKTRRLRRRQTHFVYIYKLT